MRGKTRSVCCSRRVTLVLATFAAAGLSGCATMHTVEVDAIKSDRLTFEPVSYRIVSAHPDLGDPAFVAIAAKLKTALSGRGWYEAEDRAHADQVIEMDFDGGDPQRTSVVYLGVVVNPVYFPDGSPQGSRVGAQPQIAVPGAAVDPHVVVYTKYPVFLRLTSREATPPNGRRPRQLWSVFLSTRVTDEDLEKYVPMLMAVAMGYVAENLNGKIEVKIRENDPAIAFVEAGINQSL